MSFLEAIPVIGDIFKGTKELISEAIVDKDKANELENKIEQIKLTAELELMKMEHDEKLAQVEVAKLNAASNDNYVRRARPTILWICGIGLGYQWLVHPIFCWALPILSVWYPEAATITPPPVLNLTEMMPLLMGMLGLSGLRTYEKAKGVIGK